MKKIIGLVAALTFAPSIALAQSTQICATEKPMALGPGLSSCASYLSEAEPRTAYDAWILGYVSGANAHSKDFGNVGTGTDNAGILALVAQACKERPEAQVGAIIKEYVLRMAKHCLGR